MRGTATVRGASTSGPLPDGRERRAFAPGGARDQEVWSGESDRDRRGDRWAFGGRGAAADRRRGRRLRAGPGTQGDRGGPLPLGQRDEGREGAGRLRRDTGGGLSTARRGRRAHGGPLPGRTAPLRDPEQGPGEAFRGGERRPCAPGPAGDPPRCAARGRWSR